MAIYKCKMCGGTLEINNETVVACDYCGTQQTVPTSNDEVVSNLFNRANNLRLKCEFDKAEQIYEKILDINNLDSEAHWGVVLCKYGIEYVEDPKTYSRIPTCHRTLYEAVLTDVNYLAAVENADAEQKRLYIAEAKVIDELQKNILNIVNNEEPFDVFLCYKETDENGKRTIDSAITNDIYYHLTEAGFKVFYAPITLEDKLGYEYEPYIFAALNSAKVMLVVGTKPEYFDSVWVRNEWSRFFKSMKTNRSKLLIPCYRDMDVYELPDEFAHLQAQDMGKVGAIQDLLRGIEKILPRKESSKETVKETVVVQQIVTASSVESLLKRAFMFLEDGEWTSANEYCEKVLDIDPECAEAYLGRLMIELKVRKYKQLCNVKKRFDKNGNYKKAVRFGNKQLKEICEENIKKINASKIKKRKWSTIISLSLILLALFFTTFNFNAWNNVETISAGGGHIVGLKKDGTTVAVGENSFGECDVRNRTDIVDVSAGHVHTVGLREDGTVVAIGSNYFGQCETSNWSNIIAISAGFHTVGLNKNGTVVAAGNNDYGQCNVAGWTNIVAISAGYDHTVGLRKDGTVVAAGNNDYGQCDVTGWSNIIAISAHRTHTIGLRKDGTVVATGNNNYGQCDVANWSNIVAVSAGNEHTIGLRKDGTVVATGNNYNGECDVTNWHNIVAISAADDISVGLKKDGTAFSVGYESEWHRNVDRWRNLFKLVKSFR